ncbi:hypothetical protein BAU15_08610 [Enterococcus sp. JM4C]|uniref:hypothetical protein n=1 Tax=Candidatus Enterococcus huntleyi TaxID=1857217 RepID=UPI0013798C42|nr:hypothetical protein [Enterococcus sp. JM4C]KAF1297956.1 hypothetical protein BAU15_08610 [Enterococcus sp. JM4C]
MLKKIIGLTMTVLTVLIVAGCSNKMSELDTQTEPSAHFSEKEVNAALEEVKTYFAEDTTVTKVKKISFSEAYSEKELAVYASMNDKEYPALLEEYLVISVDFTTAKESGSRNPEEENTDYNMLLHYSKNKKWEIIETGTFT